MQVIANIKDVRVGSYVTLKIKQDETCADLVEMANSLDNISKGFRVRKIDRDEHFEKIYFVGDLFYCIYEDEIRELVKKDIDNSDDKGGC